MSRLRHEDGEVQQREDDGQQDIALVLTAAADDDERGERAEGALGLLVTQPVDVQMVLAQPAAMQSEGAQVAGAEGADCDEGQESQITGDNANTVVPIAAAEGNAADTSFAIVSHSTGVAADLFTSPPPPPPLLSEHTLLDACRFVHHESAGLWGRAYWRRLSYLGSRQRFALLLNTAEDKDDLRRLTATALWITQLAECSLLEEEEEREEKGGEKEGEGSGRAEH